MFVERSTGRTLSDKVGGAVSNEWIIDMMAAGRFYCLAAAERQLRTPQYFSVEELAAKEPRAVLMHRIALAVDEISMKSGRLTKGQLLTVISSVCNDSADLIEAGAQVPIVSHMAEVRLADASKDDYGNWYDETNEGYILQIPESTQFNLAWNAFCASVKHSRRFFSKDAVEGLDKILGPVLGGEAGEGVIIRIGPDSPERMKFIYRGRSAHSEADQKIIYEAPALELAAPPVEKATAGRMNPAGISVFYGSLDQETCVAELRAPVGGQAIVGKFEVIRPLRILDLTALSSIRYDLDYFDPNFIERQAYARFIQGFHEEIKRSVIPGQETLEYLPTQVVAEYLWTRETNAVDGVIFGSAQLTDGSKNIVLFPPALTVEDAESVVRRKVSLIQRDEANEDEPEPSDTVGRAQDSGHGRKRTSPLWQRRSTSHKATRPP